MELFKLFGKIAIDGAEKANSDITNVSTNAQKSSSVIGKLGSVIQSAFKSNSIKEVDASVEKLTARMTSQQNRLDLLKRKYADLYLTHGKNSSEAKELAAEIEKLSSELQQNKEALAEAQSAADEYDKSLEKVADTAEKTSSKTGSALKKIGSVAKSVGKVVAVGLAAAATAIGALTASSVSAYADYEQLVGGVDTLFKDSSAKVQEYAKNAYTTAGLSANEYMETVTSFSASLLQSLGNDTQKAAEMADLAITDMSDNANKMGTDMASIQNAYQGFAKQNYTMLDNLKLGYGGTKEEMQRLIDDANALNAAQGNLTEYSIDSYADIVSAIHDVQTEMGITGTTAKEAATTIQGSISSMKGSWKNLLTAISSENLDIGEYVGAFVDSVSTVADNLLPRIEIALDGIVQLVSALAPKIASVIPGLVATLLPVVVNAATSLLEAVASALPGIVTAIVGCLPDIIAAIVSIVEAIVNALPAIVQSIVSVLPTLIPALIDGIVSIIVIICEKFSEIIQPIIDAWPDIIISIVEALVNNLPALIQGIISLVMGIVAAIPQIIQGIVDALPQVISMIITALLENLPAIIMGLIQVVAGIVIALPQIFAALIKGIVNIFKGIWSGIKNVFSNVGDWFSEKFTQARDSIQNAWRTVANWFREKVIDPITNFFKSMVNSVIGAINGMISGVVKGINYVTRALNNLSFVVPDWVPELGGKTFGFNIGEITAPQIPLLEQGGVLERGQVGLLEGNGAEAVVPLHQNKKWISAVADDMDEAIGGSDTAIVSVLREILEQLKIIASAGNAEVISLLAQILDSMGDDLKAQIANTTVKIDNRVVGRVVRGLV